MWTIAKETENAQGQAYSLNWKTRSQKFSLKSAFFINHFYVLYQLCFFSLSGCFLNAIVLESLWSKLSLQKKRIATRDNYCKLEGLLLDEKPHEYKIVRYYTYCHRQTHKTFLAPKPNSESNKTRLTILGFTCIYANEHLLYRGAKMLKHQGFDSILCYLYSIRRLSFLRSSDNNDNVKHDFAV